MNTKSLTTCIQLIILLININTNHMYYCYIDPTIAMCVDGEVDTAVRTADGSTYIFMNYWFWKLNDNLDKVVNNASYISHKWTHLDTDIETAFYMSGVTNNLNGQTFFIKDNNWYQFKNQVFERKGSVGNWSRLPDDDQLLVISQPNSPIIAVYVKQSDESPIGYYFDSPIAPEYHQILDNYVPFDVSETEAVVSYDDGSYLIFFDDLKVGGNCRIRDVNRGCENNRLNSDLFDCPDHTKQLFNKNWFIRWWYKSGLSLRQFAIIFLTILIIITFILTFLLIIFVVIVIQLYRKKYRQTTQ